MLQHGLLLARLVPIVEHMGKPTFGRHYLQFMNEALKVTQCSVLVFREDGPPIPIVLESTGNEDRFLRSSRTYVEDGYLTDPMVQEKWSDDTVVVQRTPKDYPDKIKKFFWAENVEYELLFRGLVGGLRISGCLQRPPDRNRFDEQEVTFIRQAFPLFAQIIRKHFELVPDVDHYMSSYKQLATKKMDLLLKHFSLFLKKDCAALTAREVEICSHIIVGYSSTAISYQLGISESTVATHRKKIYHKLRISSQNELFLRYFQRASYSL